MIPVDIKLTCRDIRRLTGLTPSFQVARVAHAGGGFNRRSHTNSHDALDHNLKQGFSHFELDFSFTKDHQLVCIHDYEENFETIFGFQTEEKPTLDAFKSLVEKTPGFKNCTLESLAVWMEQNPSVFIITDIKEDNLKALRMISETAPDFKRRIIPQIYDPSNYNSVKDIGFEQVIWTLYRYDGSDEEVIKWVDTFNGPFAVTMGETRAKSTLPAKLAKKYIPTYVHTINTPDEAHRHLNNHSITEIYTDFLHPTELTVKH